MLNSRNLFINEWECKDTVTLDTFDVIQSRCMYSSKTSFLGSGSQNCASESPGELIKTQIAVPVPRVSDPVTRDGIQIFVLLTRWQVTLRLLVQDHTVRTTVVEKLLNM